MASATFSVISGHGAIGSAACAAPTGKMDLSPAPASGPTHDAAPRSMHGAREEAIVNVLTTHMLQRLRSLTFGLGLATTIAVAPAVASEARADPERIEWKPPPDVVKFSGCVPYMGEHWARQEDWPLGPIYTVDQGRLVSIEYMPAQEALENGQSWDNLTFRYQGTPPAIDHANIDLMPHGHEGYDVPHYDMHFYVVSRDEERSITCR